MNVPMVEVQAPSHMMRKSRYSNALKTRRNTLPPPGSGEGFFALDEMEDVAIAVGEEHEPVALDYIRFGQKLNPACSQLFMGGVKVGDGDGEVAKARVLHRLRGSLALRWDNLEQRAVG